MTPKLCVGKDGFVMVAIASGSLGVCVGGLVKGDGMSVLIGHICCLLHLYVLSGAWM